VTDTHAPQPTPERNRVPLVEASIQSLLDTLLSFSSAEIEVRQDPARMRPSDVPRHVGDASKLRAATGWQPTIPFEQTLLDILNDWRQSMGVPVRPDRV